MQPYPVIYFLLVLCILGMIVHGEPEPMARPTRPEVFASPEELRRYLDHVRDYYSLSGKARYGKRDDASYHVSDSNRVWDAVKTILDVSQQSQEQRLERRQQEKGRFFSELESPDGKKRALRIEDRPCHVSDTVDKYYDDVQ